jgi:urease accessory protein UreF
VLADPRLEAYQAAVRDGPTGGSQPVVLGVVGQAAGLGRRETVLLLLHLHVATVLGAAFRLIEIGHVDAQQVRHRLGPCLATTAEASLELPWEEMYACAPQTELMTMLHERAPIRLFAS